MEGRLAAIAASQGGVVLRRQALDCGYDAEEVKRLARSRDWVRIRRGAYVDATAATKDERTAHVQRVHAVVAAATIPLVVSGASAALLHGLDVWLPDLSRVQVTHPAVAARREKDVHHHDAELDDEDRTALAGLPVTSLARTVVDVARVSTFEQSVVVADSALRTCRTTPEELRAAFDRCSQWPGVRGVARALDSADARSDNPAESRTRVFLLEHGLPDAEPQVFIYDEHGLFLGLVDLAMLGAGVLLEFDGRVKYGIGGKDPRVQVFDEKVRGDNLRRPGWELERVIWADLARPTILLERIRAAVRRAALRPPPRGFFRRSVRTRDGIVGIGAYVPCSEARSIER